MSDDSAEESEFDGGRDPGGRPSKPERDKRDERVTIRLTESELETLDEKAGELSRSEYLRQLITEGSPAGSVPAINREAWLKLSNLSSNLNQYVTAIHEGKAAGVDPDVIDGLIEQVKKLRHELRGKGEEA